MRRAGLIAKPLGDAVLPGGAGRCRRLSQSTPHRRWPAALDSDRSHGGEYRIVLVLRVRAQPCTASGGLAGDAGGDARISVLARRIFERSPVMDVPPPPAK